MLEVDLKVTFSKIRNHLQAFKAFIKFLFFLLNIVQNFMQSFGSELDPWSEYMASIFLCDIHLLEVSRLHIFAKRAINLARVIFLTNVLIAFVAY